MLEEILKAGLKYPRSYLIRGEKEVVKKAIFEAVETSWGLILAGNPNILFVNEHLNVEAARRLIEFAFMSPLGNDKIKMIILAASRMTREAQNTLLKLTEEPNQSLRIFVIVPKDVELLPTLLSRLEDISFACSSAGGGTGLLKTDAGNFLEMGLKERLKVAEKIAKDEDETTLDTFLRDLEKKVYKQKFSSDTTKEKAFSAIVFAKQASSSQSRPKRMILEALAISLPVL